MAKTRLVLLTICLVAVASSRADADCTNGNSSWLGVAPGAGVNLAPTSDDSFTTGVPSSFVVQNSTLYAFQNSSGTQTWSYQLSLGAFQSSPTVVPTSAPSGPEVVLISDSTGTVSCRRASNGGALWSTSTQRSGQSNDTLTQGVSVQIGMYSNSAFQTAFPNDDLAFITTRFYNTDAANQVVAMKVSNGAIAWRFNQAGQYAVDAGMGFGCAVDYSRNQLYCVTDQPATKPFQPTLYAISSLTGQKLWQANAGPSRVSPFLTPDNSTIIVARYDGSILQYNASNGVLLTATPQIVTTTANLNQEMAVQWDKNGEIIYLVDTAGLVHGLLPVGNTLQAAFVADNLGGELASTAPVVYSGLNKAYIPSLQGHVWQFDPILGHGDASVTVAASTLVAPPSIDVLGNSSQPNVLFAQAGTEMGAYCIPLAPGIHGTTRETGGGAPGPAPRLTCTGDGDCTSLTTSCATGVCDLGSNVCKRADLPDRTPCDDGQACTCASTSSCYSGGTCGSGSNCDVCMYGICTSDITTACACTNTGDRACPNGQTCCAGTCRDLVNDSGHCGSCTNVCDTTVTHQYCAQAFCVGPAHTGSTSLGASPTQGLAASQVTVTARRFAPSETVTLTLTLGLGLGGPTLVTTPATITTDANGQFSATATIPAGTTPGDYLIQAVGSASDQPQITTRYIVLDPSPGAYRGAQLFAVGTQPYSVISSAAGMGLGPAGAQQQLPADFNGDGKLDAATANFYSNNASVLLGNGDGTFQAATNSAVGTNPQGVTAGDWNGDSKLDLAVTNSSSGNLSVLLGNGDGTFQAAVTYAVGSYPMGVTAGDWNGDGKLDLAVANSNSSSVSVLLGYGDGTFQAQVTYGVGSIPESVTTSDWNGDGKLDLVVANWNGNSVSILLGYGNGTFHSAVSFATGSGPMSVIAADLNGDGKLDVATANYYAATVSVLLGNGNGTFQAPLSYPVVFMAYSVTAGDFDGDGKLDLAATNYGRNILSVLWGNGDGTYQPAVSYSTGAAPACVVTGDWNGDGRLDLMTANYSGANVSLMLGRVGRSFDAAMSYPAGTLARSVATGDWNGDGYLDLAAVTNTGNQVVSVLMGNGDGSFQAPVSYAAGSYCWYVTAGDLNGDGKLDLVVANNALNQLSILVGNGDGTFQSPLTINYGGTAPYFVMMGDWDGDGKTDLAVANPGSSNVSILPGNGNATFQAAHNTALTAPPYFLTAGDWDGDGKLDLATANYNNSNVAVLVGKGDGTFQTPQYLGVASSPHSITAGDWNGDHKLDLVAANYGGNNVSLLLGNGNGTFQAAVNTPVGQGPYSVIGGDWNGDGKLDIATANNGAGSVSVLLGNGDGSFRLPTAYTVGVAPTQVVVDDFNGDGRLDYVTATASAGQISILLER